MYRINDCVVYGAAGVMKIVDITRESVGGASHEYYVLSEVSGASSSKTYVPVDNEKLVGGMRYVMTAEEIERALKADSLPTVTWVRDTRARAEKFRSVIDKADMSTIVAMLRSIKETARARIADGKKVYVSDNAVLLRALKMLDSEISLAFKVDETEAREILLERCPFLKD